MNSPHPIVAWNEALVTGIEEVDQQHRYLIHAINDARIELIEKNNLGKLEQITKDLLAYAIFHFETEEDLMSAHDYATAAAADAERHHREHREFSAKVVAVRDALSAGHEVSADSVLSFLEDWLIKHIMQTDQLLGAFIRQKGQI